ncbi:hypothetical protein [Micromonospora sp. b486]|nr:hypothetical protein [Micromonospora sp. b486]MDM4778035.1 hypothetical protein [Micromonospora sp. b486]
MVGVEDQVVGEIRRGEPDRAQPRPFRAGEFLAVAVADVEAVGGGLTEP